jgi:RimJ/RimL family protein N-acetyltransferase
MRKLIGDSSQRGKGIGKRATFLFLYYTFLMANREKVFLHSLDVNLRNLTWNGKFGFYLKGVFFEDILIDSEAHDVARMALTKPVWLELFG